MMQDGAELQVASPYRVMNDNGGIERGVLAAACEKLHMGSLRTGNRPVLFGQSLGCCWGLER
jgi:hypothetical protein